MKILYTNFHDATGGGHVTYIRQLVAQLTDRFELHVASPSGSQLLEEVRAMPDVSTLAQPFPNGLGNLRAWRIAVARMRAYLAEQRFDVVHVNGSADHRLVMAARHGLRSRPRIVLTKHNTKPMRGLRHHLRARYGTDAVIAVSDYVRMSLDATPYRRCTPRTVPNGVDTRHFAPWPADQAAGQRRHLGCDEDVLLLGSSAGTAGVKGWTDLVPALQCLEPGERRQIRILVAGLPPSGEQRARIAHAGLQDNFLFPGLLSDVRPVIAAVDAGFVLSHQEAISFACREMMAMGKAVLVSRVGGLPENVVDGREGWIVAAGDNTAIAGHLRWMLGHRQQLRTMGQAARARAQQEFDLPRFVEHTARVYLDLARSPV